MAGQTAAPRPKRMMLEPLQYLWGAGSGALTGFTLGLIGGGGSILAVPLMVYLVGVPNAHVAIGTSALAVAANAAAGLFNHARANNVKWRCGGIYAAAGIVGALAGSAIGKRVDGERLLFLFALLMVFVAVLMLRRRADRGNPGAECTREKAPKVIGYGFGSGVCSGFFGIGGGFLIVPGLVASTGMPIFTAVGTSLVAVTAFGTTTAASYAFSHLVDWPLAAVFIGGGVLGSVTGTRLAGRWSGQAGRLTVIFAALVLLVAVYMLYRSVVAANEPAPKVGYVPPWSVRVVLPNALLHTDEMVPVRDLARGRTWLASLVGEPAQVAHWRDSSRYKGGMPSRPARTTS